MWQHSHMQSDYCRCVKYHLASLHCEKLLCAVDIWTRTHQQMLKWLCYLLLLCWVALGSTNNCNKHYKQQIYLIEQESHNNRSTIPPGIFQSIKWTKSHLIKHKPPKQKINLTKQIDKQRDRHHSKIKIENLFNRYRVYFLGKQIWYLAWNTHLYLTQGWNTGGG